MSLDPRPDNMTSGPLDLRPIGADDVHEMSHEMVPALRAVRPVSGHRAAVAASLAAVLAGVVVLGEFGGDEAVVDALRRHLATAEGRIAAHAAGARRATVN